MARAAPPPPPPPPPQAPIDVNLREALEERYLAYALSTIMGRALAGRARRAEAGASAHPLRHAYPEARSGRGVQEMREDRRRRDGLVPSARRPGDLRGAGAARAGFLLALSAGRRAGQFRQYRRRQRRRLSLHRSADDRFRAAAARRHRRRLDRLARQLFRRREGADRAAGGDAEPARQWRAGHRGRHGDLDPAAQCRRTAATPRSI